MRKTALALVTSGILIAVFSVSSANARNGHGFLADVGVATGIISADQADALDEAHRAIGSPLNQFAQPPGQPAGAAQASQPLPYCAFSDGQMFPLPPAAVPNGAPCWHQFTNGVFNGQVVWN
jgi:hypothetical protein